MFIDPLLCDPGTIILGILGLTAAQSAGAFDPKPPEVPTEADTKEARRKRMEELQARRGRGASLVTGGAGLTMEPTLGKPSLLGAA